jgi:hypothetical protein
VTDEVSKIRKIILLPRGEFAPLAEMSISAIILALLSLILVFSAVAFFFQLIIGGLKMILSAGKKENVDAAVRTVFNSLIGFSIVLSSWAIMGFVGYFFGIDLTSFQIPSL